MQVSIQALEKSIELLPQAHCPVRHFLAGGLYAREITIPGGVVLTGAVHRHEHLCTISQGRLLVTVDGETVDISAPATLISKPGAKRAGYALETTVWTTYHYVGDETDIDRISEEILESTREELMGGKSNVQMLSNKAFADRLDYQKFLGEYDLAEPEVLKRVEYMGDHVDFPEDFTSLVEGASKISGIGMFATHNISIGELVAPIRMKGKRTPAGRRINHSCKPNVVFVPAPDDGLYAVAFRDIDVGDEVTIDYRQAMSVNGTGNSPVERTIL